MESTKPTPRTIDEYISNYPDDVQEILQKIRSTIRKTAPEAEEKISYQLATFTLHGKNLIHFGAFKKHIGLYPTPSGISQFSAELAMYKGAKGSVQFPLDEPIPYGLIRRIAEFRVRENRAQADEKRKS
jgi:uncharacterized protein YdhG (YjbR/CyaY superfamily)